jgi:xylulokinase
MKILGLDFGSTSVKAAILSGTRVVGTVARTSFPTHYDGVRAEVNAKDILRATREVIGELGSAAKKVDTIALSVMSPAWVAMDHEGRALTPIVTHQDRRSVEIARELEKRLGKKRWLKLAGNRPAPGGISCTTWAWFLKHAPGVLKKADLCGHLNTFLHRQITHARVTDPSNASFTGLYETLTQKGWNDELIDAVGIQEHRLPQVIGADGIGGFVAQSAQREFGLAHGTPVLAGCVDGSAAMLLTGARNGQLVNVLGSSDVLAMCTEKPVPHENLITRALGTLGTHHETKWLSVSTIAAAGASFDWAKRELFRELDGGEFWRVVKRISGRKLQRSDLRFDPYLAGERTSIEQRKGAFSGLTLATTREDLLGAMIEGLARASAERIELLSSLGTKLKNRVVVSSRAGKIGDIMHRDWKGRWNFKHEDEAALRGLGTLVPRKR